jgi:hypothetical protein
MIKLLSAIVGGIGNCKTLFMTYKAFLYHMNGYDIISNYWLKIPHTPIKDYKDITSLLTEIKEKHETKWIYMAMDEFWTQIDSRLAGSWDNINWSRFLMQTRKVNFDVDSTAQDLGQFDKRFRQVLDRIFIPKVLLWESKPRKSKPILMSVKCMKKDIFGVFYPYNNLVIKTPDELLDLYNTFEII